MCPKLEYMDNLAEEVKFREWPEEEKSVFYKSMAGSECAMDRAWAEMQKLHPNKKSAGLLLVCNCKKCMLSRGTL